MTPLDDELRTTLAERASELRPPVDVMAGVERRARGLRRRRAAGAVAGSALAVAALGLGGPAAVTALSDSPAVTPASTASDDGAAVSTPAPSAADPSPSDPSPSATPDPSEDGSAPDPGPDGVSALLPWEPRGDVTLLDGGTDQAVAREWGVRHGLAEADVQIQTLYVELYEPSAQVVVVFAALDGDGELRWGVAATGEAGPELLVDEPLAVDADALVASLPGDEVGRLLVVATPAAGGGLYYPQGRDAEPVPMADLAPGVFTAALEGDLAVDQWLVLGGDGDALGALGEGATPDVPGGTSG